MDPRPTPTAHTCSSGLLSRALLGVPASATAGAAAFAAVSPMLLPCLPARPLLMPRPCSSLPAGACLVAAGASGTARGRRPLTRGTADVGRQPHSTRVAAGVRARRAPVLEAFRSMTGGRAVQRWVLLAPQIVRWLVCVCGDRELGGGDARIRGKGGGVMLAVCGWQQLQRAPPANASTGHDTLPFDPRRQVVQQGVGHATLTRLCGPIKKMVTACGKG